MVARLIANVDEPVISSNAKACAAVRCSAPSQERLLSSRQIGARASNQIRIQSILGWCLQAGEVHGIQQLSSGACPATFTNNPAAGQRQLFAVCVFAASA